MERKQFKISINASREKVWEVLWDDPSYRSWTSVFSEGSYAETDWKKGSKARFLSASGDGMVSTISANIPPEFMSIKHLGIVKKGIEDLDSAEARQWKGALENYTLQMVGGVTELTIDMDIADEYQDYFQETLPKSLKKIKELSEPRAASLK